VTATALEVFELTISRRALILLHLTQSNKRHHQELLKWVIALPLFGSAASASEP
jgi:hypothetical protein